jgi:hypothetical protein
MTELTTYQLDMIARYLCNFPTDYNMFPRPVTVYFDMSLIDICQNLYRTGLRYNEISTISNFSMLSETEVIIQTSKGSNPITVPISDLTPNLLTCISTQAPPYREARYSTFCRWIEKALGTWQPYTSGKRLSAHLFRHNRFKQLHEERFTVAEIQLKTGEVNPLNVLGYIDSIIYRKP